jgi:hypothetical protein
VGDWIAVNGDNSFVEKKRTGWHRRPECTRLDIDVRAVEDVVDQNACHISQSRYETSSGLLMWV